MSFTPEQPGKPGNPNTLSAESENTPGNPNTLSAESENTPGNPNTLSAESENTPGNPNTLSAESENTPGNPNALSAESENTPGNPNTLSAESENTPGNPNTLSAESVAAVPRTIEPRICLNFGADLFELNSVAKALTDIVTYTRNSSATYIEQFTNQFGRKDHRLVTDFVGSVENLVTYSEQFDNADWDKINASITPNVIESPISGDRTADKLTSTTTGDLISNTASVTSGNTYNFSVYVKKGNTDESFLLVFSTGFTTSIATFDIVSGVVISETGAAFNSAIQHQGNGWFRVSSSCDATSTTSGVVRIQHGGSSSNVYHYIWGAQVTESAKPLPYVKTLASSASDTFTESPRLEYDAATGESLGYFSEGSSTNLFTYSEDFSQWGALNASISSNEQKSLDETMSADKLSDDGVNANHQISLVPDIASDTDTTFSVFAKDNGRRYMRLTPTGDDGTSNSSYFDLQQGSVQQQGSSHTAKIKSFGDGWYRCSVSFNTGSGATSNTCRIALSDGSLTASYVGDGSSIYIWGAQVEEQPFATSYIRTEGSTVSRSADANTVSQSIIAGTSEYSFMIEGDFQPDDGTNRDGVRASGLNSTSAIITRTSAGNIAGRIGFATTVTLSSGTDEVSGKFVVTRSGDTQVGYLDGVQVDTNTLDAFQVDVSGTIGIGEDGSGTQQMFGHIKKLVIYDQALTAQEVSLL